MRKQGPVTARSHVECCLHQAPSKDEGQGVVEFSGQDVVSWCTPWQDLYLVLAQVYCPVLALITLAMLTNACSRASK